MFNLNNNRIECASLSKVCDSKPHISRLKRAHNLGNYFIALRIYSNLSRFVLLLFLLWAFACYKIPTFLHAQYQYVKSRLACIGNAVKYIKKVMFKSIKQWHGNWTAAVVKIFNISHTSRFNWSYWKSHWTKIK